MTNPGTRGPRDQKIPRPSWGLAQFRHLCEGYYKRKFFGRKLKKILHKITEHVAHPTSGQSPWTAFEWPVMLCVDEELKASIRSQILPRRTPTPCFSHFPPSPSIQIPPNQWRLVSDLGKGEGGGRAGYGIGSGECSPPLPGHSISLQHGRPT